MFKKQAPRQQTKVKFLCGIAGGAMPEYDMRDFSFTPGLIYTIDAELAAKWISSGICEAAQ